MIKVDCNYCGQELQQPGALVFSPPDENGNCTKSHCCVKCFTAKIMPLVAPMPKV